MPRDTVLGKKTVFGIVMTEVRDTGLPGYGIGKENGVRDCYDRSTGHGIAGIKERECEIRNPIPDLDKPGDAQSNLKP